MEDRVKYANISSITGVIINITIGIAMFLCGLFTNSIAIMADGIHNLTDCTSAIVTFFGFRIASSKPNKDHPFGYGRYEYIAGAVVSMIIVIAGFELARDGIAKMFSPESPTINNYVFYILIASILLKFFLFYLNNKLSKKIGSATLKAVARDNLMDCISTLAVIISSLLYMFHKINIDSYLGTLIGLLIIRTGFVSLKETIAPLLGKAPEKEFVDSLKQIVKVHKKVLGMHDLVVHDYGPGRIIVTLHAEVPAEANILELHDEIDDIEKELEEQLHCQAVIHLDPLDTTDKRQDKLKKKLNKFIKSIDKDLSFHNFRMGHCKTHTKLIFDLDIPSKLDEYEIKHKICEFIEELSKEEKEDYHAEINVG